MCIYKSVICTCWQKCNKFFIWLWRFFFEITAKDRLRAGLLSFSFGHFMPSFLFQTFRIIYSLNLVAFKDRKPHTGANFFYFFISIFKKKKKKKEEWKAAKKSEWKREEKRSSIRIRLEQIFSSYQPYTGQILKDCDIRISSKLFHDLSSSLNLFFRLYWTPL